MANQRILQGAAATLTFRNLDADGSPVDAGGALTVGVIRADGTVLVAAGTATTHSVTPTNNGIYTVALTGVQTATLDLLTATWTEAGVSAHTTLHEIVGGYVFTIAEVRAFESLGDETVYPTAKVIITRADVEDELERLREAAFVPRYARLTLDGTGEPEILTGRTFLRRLRTVKVLVGTGSSSSTSFTATQLASCVVTDDGRIRRGDSDIFPYGVGNIIVEVEHGFTDWGADLKTAALTRLRERLNRPASEIGRAHV